MPSFLRLPSVLKNYIAETGIDTNHPAALLMDEPQDEILRGNGVAGGWRYIFV